MGVRNRWPALAGGVVAGMAIGLAVLFIVLRGGSSEEEGEAEGSGDGSSVVTVVDPSELPEVDPEVAAATLEYLDGDGRSLVAMVVVGERAGSLFEAEACGAAKDELSGLGSPAELASSAAGVGDEVTHAAVESVRSGLVGVLAACQAGESDEEEAGRVVDAAVLFRQRIEQLEAA